MVTKCMFNSSIKIRIILHFTVFCVENSHRKLKKKRNLEVHLISLAFTTTIR